MGNLYFFLVLAVASFITPGCHSLPRRPSFFLVGAGTPYPYLLAIREGLGKYPKCGAVLIKGKSETESMFALTAAHCVCSTATNSLKVFASETAADRKSSINRSIKEVFCHPDYKEPNPRSDMAILVLDKPLPFNANTAPIRVHSGLESNADAPKQGCKIIGWGMTQTANGKNIQPKQLHATDIELLTCTDHGIMDNTEFICYSPQQASTCYGDSGGAVVCDLNRIPTLVAIHAGTRSDQMCESGGVSFGTNVNYNFPWVMDTINQYDGNDMNNMRIGTK